MYCEGNADNISYNDLLILELVNFSCDCSNYIYLTNHHGDLFTWDLWITEYAKLCKIISKGPNFMEQYHCGKVRQLK